MMDFAEGYCLVVICDYLQGLCEGTDVRGVYTQSRELISESSELVPGSCMLEEVAMEDSQSIGAILMFSVALTFYLLIIINN